MVKNNLKDNKLAGGFVSLDKLKKTPGYPSEERFKKGPVVVVECTEEIPCNPCETTCSKHVIKVGGPITNLPELADEFSCNGCANCVIKCPGLAVFIIDKTYSDKEAAVSLPYELLPLPQKGTEIKGLDRTGNEVCRGKVIKVLSGKALNKTNVVTIAIPKDFADDVRFFKNLQ
jgi:Fe-S-cluster-containing hydrogenase component 2